MKKVLIIILVIFLIFACILFFKFNQNNPSDFFCKTNYDCILINNHPSSPSKCVNKHWKLEWDNNSKSKETEWECMAEPVCTGSLECLNLIPEDKYCECINEQCERADVSKYGPWQWVC
ncbi:MAG: hypothetical protein ACOYT4_05205 [Nanoarchaeota archaeon]